MLMCVDVGNTNICLGLFEDNKLIEKFRLSTNAFETADEYGVKIKTLIELNNIKISRISGVIIGSVVPQVDGILERTFKKYFNINPIFVAQGIKSGINIKIDNPKELGADLLVGAVGAANKYGAPVLIIDMGTAITFAFVNSNKEFLGGVIAAGIKTSYSSLIANTSKLEAVKMNTPNEIIGKNTINCIQNGMVYGTSSMIDVIIKRIHNQYGDFVTVLTGGDSVLINDYLEEKVVLDEDLLFDGLRILYEKNQKNK